ncbi:MAG: hypothetical protein AAF171_05395 [Cyanobacteria bacterium P01_A01_bin.116]
MKSFSQFKPSQLASIPIAIAAMLIVTGAIPAPIVSTSLTSKSPYEPGAVSMGTWETTALAQDCGPLCEPDDEPDEDPEPADRRRLRRFINFIQNFIRRFFGR